MNRSISKKTAVLTLLISFVILIGLVWIATLAVPTSEDEPYLGLTSQGWEDFGERFEKIGPYNMFATGNSNIEIQDYDVEEVGEIYLETVGYSSNRLFNAISTDTVKRFNQKDYTLNDERYIFIVTIHK